MSETAVDESQDAAAGFAALMNKAAEQAGTPAEEAPYGWTTDPDGNRLRGGRCCAAGERYRDIKAAAPGEAFAQQARFRGAAENKDAWHG